MNPAELAQVDALPLHSRTPAEWAHAVLADPIALLIDHAFLEKKAAANAMELLTRWPNDGVDGWVETMTSVARDETAHLAQVTRILLNRGGQLDRIHKNPYANSLRLLVRKGHPGRDSGPPAGLRSDRGAFMRAFCRPRRGIQRH